MNLSRAVLLVCFALFLAAPGTAQEAEAPSQECSEPAMRGWLEGCVAVIVMPRVSSPPSAPVEPRNPWSIIESPKIVEMGPFLPERIVETCKAAGSEPPCERDTREWLAGCVDEALDLIGRRREAIPSATFQREGGISVPPEVGYLHNRCPYLKLRVKFDCALDEDGRPIDDLADVIVSVEPYLDLIHSD